jgi:hypothetical protein
MESAKPQYPTGIRPKPTYFMGAIICFPATATDLSRSRPICSPATMSCASVWTPRYTLDRSSSRGPGGRRRSSSVRPRAAAEEGGGCPRMVLHDSLDAAGVGTTHARAARDGFAAQVGRFTRVAAASSIAVGRGPDLARAALCIAAEDDSLVSHSSVSLPIEAFISRLDGLSTGFCAGGNFPPIAAPAEVFFDYLDRYLYGYKVQYCST